jgi:hypothetical protein
VKQLNNRLVRSYGIPDIAMPIGTRTKCYGSYSWSTPSRLYKVEFERCLITGNDKSFLTISSV